MSFSLVLLIIGVVILLLYIKSKMNRPKCTINHSMKGKLIIVTGASSGVGKSTAFDLL